MTGLAWVLPFLQPYHRYPITAFYSEWIAFVLGLGAALTLLSRLAWREATVPVVSAAPVALIVVLGAQVLLGRVPYAEQALVATLYLLWAALLVLLGHALARMGTLASAATVLSWFLVAGGVLAALTGLLQQLEISTPFDFLIGRKVAAQVYGNLGQPNHYASYLSLALASIVYLYCSRRLHGAPAGAFSALLLLVLALTGSRSVWLYLGALAVLAMAWHRALRDETSLRLVVAAACLLPASLAVQWVAALPLLEPAGETSLTSGQRLFELAGGVDSRLQLWREAWGLFQTAPILGAGLGRFAWHHFVQSADTGMAAAPGVYNHAHNIVLALLAETGLVGALCVVGAALLWLADLRRVTPDPAGWWIVSLLTVLGIHSLLEYPLWYSYFLGIAALLVGLGARRACRLRHGLAARVTLGLLLLAGFVNAIAVLPSYREFERLVFSPETRASPPPEAEYARAVVGLYREPLLVPYVELAIAFGATVDEERLGDKLALTARAVHFAPVPVVATRYAMLLALAGQREAARIQLERALRAYPWIASETLAQLERLSRDRPATFRPLLEWTAGKGADSVLRARQTQ